MPPALARLLPLSGAHSPRRLPSRTEVSAAHKILLFQQLEMLLSSGILIADALACLAERFPDRRMRRLLGDVHAQVAGSRCSLSQALAGFPRAFPPSVVVVVEAGEQGGSALLAQRFADLAERTACEDARRRQIARACAYPLFVSALAAALYVLLLELVFPLLAGLLASLGSELPPLTRMVVAASSLARRDWPFAALPVLGTPVLFLALRRLPAARRRIDGWFLRLPLVGAVYRDATVALICKIYRSLYLAGLPAPAGIGLCIKLVDNHAFREALDAARRDITQNGAALSAALSRTGLFPPLACLAIEVGERSGRIAPALDRVSAYFGDRAKDRMQVAISVINPLLTLAVVGGAGIILISFFQAAYQIVYATR